MIFGDLNQALFIQFFNKYGYTKNCASAFVVFDTNCIVVI